MREPLLSLTLPLPQRAVAAAGGVALLVWNSVEIFLRPDPGRQANFWVFGEPATFTAVPAADITSREGVALIELAKAGTPVRVRVLPDISPFERVWSSGWWIAWQLVLGLHTLMAAEFAATQLLRFVLANKGFNPSNLPQAVLFIEFATTSMRAAAFVDPMASRGLFSFPWGHLLTICLPNALASVSWLLLTNYFLTAAEQGGMATARVASPTRAYFVAAFTAVIVGSLFAIDFGTTSSLWITIKLFLFPVGYPALCIGLARYFEREVRRHECWLPDGVFARLSSVLRRATLVGLVDIVLNLAMPWASSSPWRVFFVAGVSQSLRNTITLIVVGSFAPAVGVNPIRGPLCRAFDILAAGLLLLLDRLCGPRDHFSKYAQHTQRVRPLSRDSEASQAARLSAPDSVEESDADGLEPWQLGMSLSLLREIAAAHEQQQQAHQLERARDDTTVGAFRAMAAARHRSRFKRKGARDAQAAPLSARSVAEVLAKSCTMDGQPAVGKATAVVVHEQLGSFKALLHILERWSEQHVPSQPHAHGAHALEHVTSSTHANGEHYFWLDVGCARPAGSKLQQAASAVRSAGAVVLAMESVIDQRPLCRLECLHMLLVAQQHGLPIHLALPSAVARALQTPDVADRARELLAQVDLTTASSYDDGVTTAETVLRHLAHELAVGEPAAQAPANFAHAAALDSASLPGAAAGVNAAGLPPLATAMHGLRPEPLPALMPSPAPAPNDGVFALGTLEPSRPSEHAMHVGVGTTHAFAPSAHLSALQGRLLALLQAVPSPEDPSATATRTSSRGTAHPSMVDHLVWQQGGTAEEGAASAAQEDGSADPMAASPGLFSGPASGTLARAPAEDSS